MPGPRRGDELRSRGPGERDLSAGCPTDAIPRPGEHAAEKRYLSEQGARLQGDADSEPGDVTVPQPSERRAETGDVR